MTESLRISALTLEYLRYPITARRDGADIDPTGDAVAFAVVAARTEPVSGDWKVGEWEIDGDTTYARVLVGPGGTITLTPERYDVWLRITDDPEIPVRKIGSLRVF